MRASLEGLAPDERQVGVEEAPDPVGLAPDRRPRDAVEELDGERAPVALPEAGDDAVDDDGGDRDHALEAAPPVGERALLHVRRDHALAAEARADDVGLVLRQQPHGAARRLPLLVVAGEDERALPLDLDWLELVRRRLE